MRNFQTLDTITIDDKTGICSLTTKANAPLDSQIAIRREGDYVVISASFGPLEIALRPRYEELQRTLSRLKPIDGLQTSRQLGTAQAYIAFGLRMDKTLVVRPTIVADASGHIVFNLMVSPDVREQLYFWLNCVPE
jgi:hypothetical protein